MPKRPRRSTNTHKPDSNQAQSGQSSKPNKGKAVMKVVADSTSVESAAATPKSPAQQPMPDSTDAATPESSGPNNSAPLRNSTGNLSDIPPGHLNPIVATQRVDPDKENSRLQATSEKRREVAKKLLQQSDLSQFLKPLKNKHDNDEEEGDPIELPQVEPLNLVINDNNDEDENDPKDDSQDSEERVIGTLTKNKNRVH